MTKSYFFILLLLGLSSVVKCQFISDILDYKPAPGQLINTATVGSPCAIDSNMVASIVGKLSGTLSLGAFGGYVVFRFEEPVQNHADNPYGVDFVIYGNPMPNMVKPENGKLVSWAEPGVVWVMADENQNGKADDVWYELAGSDHFFSSTQHEVSVTYSNPQAIADVPWEDNLGNEGEILTNEFHKQSYYPLADSFPQISQTNYTLTGTRLGTQVDKSNPAFVNLFGRTWGYADNVLKRPYNGLPDNPYTPNVVENSGGDAFDISWAVNSQGEYVDLAKIDFIKVQSAILANAGWLGEVSTELAGAFDVAPNASITGNLDMIVVNDLPDTVYTSPYNLEAFVYHKGRRIDNASFNWQVDQEFASVNQQNELVFTGSGNLQIIVSELGNSLVADTLNTVLKMVPVLESTESEFQLVAVAPNPATEYFKIIGCEQAQVLVHNQQGVLVKEQAYIQGETIGIADFPCGVYVVTIKSGAQTKKVKLVK